MRDFRLIPIVLLASGCLLALKVLGLVLHGGYTLADLGSGYSEASDRLPAPQRVAQAASPPATIPAVAPPVAKPWWLPKLNLPDITGSSEAAHGSAPKADAAPA